jgi:glycosyltransferase involved in cell wall biosynthesis
MRNTNRAELRVLHCIPQVAGGGAERQLRDLAPLMAERGIDVAIFARFNPGDQLSPNIRRFPVGCRGNYNPRIVFELLRAIRLYRPHVVQSWLTQMDILCGIVAPFHSAKWVIAERSSATGYPSSIKNRLRHSLGLDADLLIANSRGGLGAWARDGIIIPNGISQKWVDGVAEGLHRSDGHLGGRFVVISIARLSREKRLPVLIGAIERASREVGNIMLLLVGAGPERAALEGLVRQRQLEDYVHFAGFQEDRIEWLKSADILASAGSYEGHPNAVLEAGAAGIAMVLSDIAEHREAAGPGALYAPGDDESALAGAIISLAQSPGERKRLGDAARRHVEDFSIEAAADAYIDAYRNLVAANR